ncbi:hypothetical protein HanPSC8_Chr01g0023691 [Helianthus annuus]|nr:hypothetical protein HanPSC8_Chr01g0023691 [Helianthus annuus]
MASCSSTRKLAFSDDPFSGDNKEVVAKSPIRVQVLKPILDRCSCVKSDGPGFILALGVYLVQKRVRHWWAVIGDPRKPGFDP